LILPIKEWDVIFFYFLDENRRQEWSVVKVPAAILNTEIFSCDALASYPGESIGSCNAPSLDHAIEAGTKCHH